MDEGARESKSRWAVVRLFEDVAEVLGNGAAIVRKHYAKWSRGRQNRIAEMMCSVFLVQNWLTLDKQNISSVLTVS